MLTTVRSRLFVSYLVIIVFTLGALGLLLSLFLIPRVQNQLVLAELERALAPTALQIRAETLRNGRELGRDQLVPALRQAVTEVSERRGLRIMALDDQYRVLADSEGTLTGQSFDVFESSARQQPQGLTRGIYRTPDGKELLWIGRLIESSAQPEAESGRRLRFILVLAQSLQDSPSLSDPLRNQFLIGGAASLALALLLALLVARSIARPLQRVAAAAKEVARGKYDLHLDIASPDEVRSVANSFNTMTQAVKASQQAQRDFVANVSHELKTPLTSIQGFSQALLDGTAIEPASIQQAASIIHDEADRMARLVSQLLDLAKIEAGQIVMAREAVNLRAVLESCVEKMTPQAAQGDVSLTTDLAKLPAVTRVTGDGDRLAQVFIVLLDNAIKHTPAGGKVTVAAQRVDSSHVAVSVSDTGPGIPAEDLSRIFERFYQVDKSRAHKKGGAGLGLAIAKEIVAAHGGDIIAESIVGVGSKFTVQLPLAGPKNEDQAATAQRRPI
jgi:two-component system OmpR family sensor kinase